MPAPTVFCCYADKDEQLWSELSAHLDAQVRAGRIARPVGRKVGDDWGDEADLEMAGADIVLVLVSPRLMASDYCWGGDVTVALRRHSRGEATVVPVVVDGADRGEETPLDGLTALPRSSSQVDRSDRDGTWAADVADDVGRLGRAIQGDVDAGAVRDPVEVARVSIPDGVRPRWKEFEHGDGCEIFGPGCTTMFHLEEFVEAADLFFEIELVNISTRPVLLSRVGVEIGEVASILYVYGIPEPARIEPPTDVHTIAMPDLREDRGGRDVRYRVDRHFAPERFGRLYVPAQSRYLYELHLTSYQRNVPNHARLRLTAEVDRTTLRSPPVHVFTW